MAVLLPQYFWSLFSGCFHVLQSSSALLIFNSKAGGCLKKKISHAQDFYRPGVAEKVPFPSLRGLSSAHRGSLGSGLVPAREADPAGPPCGAGGGFPHWPSPASPGPWSWPGAAPQLQPKLLQKPGRKRSKVTPLHPLPHPLLHPRAAKGHAHPHRDLPQPNPTPCGDANLPGARTLTQGDPTTRPAGRGPQGCHEMLALRVTRGPVQAGRVALAFPPQVYIPREQHAGSGAAPHPGVPTTAGTGLGKAGLRQR